MTNEIPRRQYLKRMMVGGGAIALAGCAGGGGGGGDDGGSGGGGGGGGGSSMRSSWESQEMATATAKEHPQLLEASEDLKSLSGQSATVSHLTWAGYDGSNVQQPFRQKFDAQTELDLFSEDPKAINRLAAGEWKNFDIFTPNNAFVVDAVEQDLIRPIDEEAWRPYTFDNYLEMFQPENGYKFGHVNEDGEFDADGQLYALPQRWGWVSMCVNTDVVSESDYQSYDIAWSDKYNVGLSDWFFWMIQIIMLKADVDPYKEHSDQEFEQIKQATFDLFDNTQALYPNVAAQNQALKNGEIDILIMSSNFGQGTLRREGNMNFKNVIPGEEGGILWCEQDTFVKGQMSPLADNYVAYLQSPEAAYNLSWPQGASSVNVVPHKSVFDEYSEEQKRVLRVDDLNSIIENSVWFDNVPDLSDFQPIWRQAKARI